MSAETKPSVVVDVRNGLPASFNKTAVGWLKAKVPAPHNQFVYRLEIYPDHVLVWRFDQKNGARYAAPTDDGGFKSVELPVERFELDAELPDFPGDTP